MFFNPGPNDMLIMTDVGNQCVSLLTSNGRFLDFIAKEVRFLLNYLEIFTSFYFSWYSKEIFDNLFLVKSCLIFLFYDKNLFTFFSPSIKFGSNLLQSKSLFIYISSFDKIIYLHLSSYSSLFPLMHCSTYYHNSANFCA